MKAAFMLAGLLLSLTACQSAALQPALSNGGADNRAALEAAISEMLGGVSITLADNAFTQKSELSIERRRQQGRTYEMPDHFRLWIEDDVCILEHVESGDRQTVPELSCLPTP